MKTKRMALPRRIAAVGLCAVLSLNCMGAVPALAAEEADAGNLLYFVDAGGDGTGVTDGMGSAQSVWDQAYGEDADTGMAWGYEGAPVAHSGEDYWGSVRVDEQDTPGKGITYRFQLEPGLYRVEVGMKEYWNNDSRSTDIKVEGKFIEKSVIPQEHSGGVSVSSISALPKGDDELTVEIVRSADNDGSYEDPLVSYIRIESLEQYASFTGVEGRPYYDTNGNQIQAHGGQIQPFTVDGQTKYYWVGEDKTNDYLPGDGVHVYTSTDLYNWTDEGLALRTMKRVEDIDNDDYFHALYGDLNAEERAVIFASLDRNNSVIERPKMLYNKSTGKYVIWFHADYGDYSKADAGVAIGDSPTGPFRLLGTYDLNYVLDMDQGFDGTEHLGAVRDMNLFQDDDGTAYIIYSSQGNQTTFISKLNSDYTGLFTDRDSAVRGVDFEIAFAGDSREAPAMFKYNGMYYMINSGCTGWDPNEARYAVAEHPFGPWTVKGNPCRGTDAGTTFHTQSTCVFPVDAEAGKFIYMGDRWNRYDLSESRYVWLPVDFYPGSELRIDPMSNWTLEDLEGKGVVTFAQPLFDCCGDRADFAAKLPQTADLRWSGKDYEDQTIAWSSVPQECFVGQRYTVTGTVTGEGALNGKTVTHTAWIADPNTLYFFDCGANASKYFDVLAQAAELRNGQPDQAYSAENGAGYLGVVDTDFGRYGGSDPFESGWWAKDEKTISYRFDHLEAGAYTVTTGYREWWPQYTESRGMSVKVTDQEGQTLASKEVTLYDDDVLDQLTFTLASETSVTVTVEKTDGADQVLSLIGLSKAKFDVTWPEGVNGTGSAVSGEDLTFTAAEGYLLLKAGYKIGGGETVYLTADGEGVYTVPGSAITGTVEIVVEQAKGGWRLIGGETYKAAPAGKQVAILETEKRESGTYAISGVGDLFWSSKYEGYVCFVPVGETAESLSDKLTVSADQGTEIAYDGNLDGVNGVTPADLLPINAILHGTDLTQPVSEKTRLAFDVTGDGVVSAQDMKWILDAYNGNQ